MFPLLSHSRAPPYRECRTLRILRPIPNHVGTDAACPCPNTCRDGRIRPSSGPAVPGRSPFATACALSLIPSFSPKNVSHIDLDLTFLKNYPVTAVFFVELLLNLAWLLLALPAYWLWRDSRTAHDGRRFTSLQILLALGCMLVVLFPVISATDDLRAMRAEMEESPAGKRSVCQKSGEKSSTAKWHSQPLLAAVSDFFVVHDTTWHTVPVRSFFTPEFHRVDLRPRAPPQPVLA